MLFPLECFPLGETFTLYNPNKPVKYGLLLKILMQDFHSHKTAWYMLVNERIWTILDRDYGGLHENFAGKIWLKATIRWP